ncbi:MAG TPA: hypothetical protein V6C65_15015 [Allocoleopsis sp.]
MFRQTEQPEDNKRPSAGGEGRSAEFDVPYGDASSKSPYTMPSDLLSFTPENVKTEIEKVKKATEKLKAANRLIPYLQKFTEEWDLFLRQLKALRVKMAKAEISKAQFEASSRVLAAKLAQAFESILQKETDQKSRISQRATQVKQRAKERV